MNSKRQKVESKMDPRQLMINEMMSMSEDQIIEKVTERKNEEWENLPIKFSDGKLTKKERVNEIVFGHYHHPTDFHFSKWMHGFQIKNTEPIQMLGMNQELEGFVMEMEVYRSIENMRVTNNPILESQNLKEILSYFLNEISLAFNFMCTETGKNSIALIANICEFDAIYFCILLDTKGTNISSLFKESTYSNGIILLQYDYNSESISAKEGEAKRNQSDNVQRDEYHNLIERMPKINVKIQNMFYFACPCIVQGKLNPEDVIRCINSEL